MRSKHVAGRIIPSWALGASTITARANKLRAASESPARPRYLQCRTPPAAASRCRNAENFLENIDKISIKSVDIDAKIVRYLSDIWAESGRYPISINGRRLSISSGLVSWEWHATPSKNKSCSVVSIS